MIDFVAAMRRDSEALAEAAAANLGRPVPSCPGWSLADLVWHTGEVHHFWGSIVHELARSPHDIERATRPPDDGLIAWFRDRSSWTAAVLESTAPETPVWTWGPQKDVGFVRRRMAHETTVHRWDAQAAAGTPDPIDPTLAGDGIDEFLDLWMVVDASLDDPGESVHLHATDGAGEWLAEVAGGRVRVVREHAKGDVAVRGGASDLLLLLWGRIPPARLEVLGDVALLERFLARPDLS